MPTLPLRAKDVFLQALDVPIADRQAFVLSACGTDDRLRQEVESLLAYHDDSTGSLGGPGTAASTSTAPTGTATSGGRFAAGQVFADRYRMIARLGKGGM